MSPDLLIYNAIRPPGYNETVNLQNMTKSTWNTD